MNICKTGKSERVTYRAFGYKFDVINESVQLRFGDVSIDERTVVFDATVVAVATVVDEPILLKSFDIRNRYFLMNLHYGAVL